MLKLVVVLYNFVFTACSSVKYFWQDGKEFYFFTITSGPVMKILLMGKWKGQESERPRIPIKVLSSAGTW
jgi:hypothetical protein